MTYAIIETGGKQIRVEPGRFYDIELLSAEPDETVTIESVLLVQHNGEVTIGQPLVAGARVQGTVMRHFRGRKVLVYKMKPKKKTRKKRGHRQEITRLMINTISLNGLVFTSEQAATAETQPSPASSELEHQPAEEQATTAETQLSPDSSEVEHQPAQTPAEEQAATAETQPSPDSSEVEHQPAQTPAAE
ncbi:MAG: 50S ribosomal protein L21 [Stigonema ocellatum SAG 48.90 = DSM 106950]|nr:50S ribosomal protein L21 [Stigonema ocellatum SAG 48.90 = DSM 106950]